MEIASKLHIPEGECLYDGAELGSTGRIDEWSYRDVSAVTANKLYNCK
jgi:hypothetical protein